MTSPTVISHHVFHIGKKSVAVAVCVRKTQKWSFNLLKISSFLSAPLMSQAQCLESLYVFLSYVSRGLDYNIEKSWVSSGLGSVPALLPSYHIASTQVVCLQIVFLWVHCVHFLNVELELKGILHQPISH